MQFIFEPYVGALPIKFGMKQAEVRKLLGKPKRKERQSDNYGPVNITYRSGEVHTIDFLHGAELMYRGRNLIEPYIEQALVKFDSKPREMRWLTVVFFELGIETLAQDWDTALNTYSIFPRGWYDTYKDSCDRWKPKSIPPKPAQTLRRKRPDLIFELVPHLGIGPVKFGMTPNQVANALNKHPAAGRLLKNPETNFFGFELECTYGKDNKVDCIMTRPNDLFQCVFAGNDLFDMAAQEVFKLFAPGESERKLRFKKTGQILPDQIVVFGDASEAHDTPPENGRDVYSVIGIGNKVMLEEESATVRKAKTASNENGGSEADNREMAESGFPENFPADSGVPTLLAKLWRFEKNIGGFYSGTFELSDGGRLAAKAWSKSPKVAKHFVLFAHEADDSWFGYWLYEGRTISNAPLVRLGSDGDVKVLANTIEELLSLLAVGGKEFGLYLEEADDPNENLPRFRKWLKRECNLSPAKNPLKLVQNAESMHPNLQEWISERRKQKGSTKKGAN